MFSLKIKAWLAAGAAALIGLLAAIARIGYLKAQRDRYRDHAETYKAQAHQAQLNEAADAEIEQEFSRRAEQAKEAIKNGKVPDHLRGSDF